MRLFFMLCALLGPLALTAGTFTVEGKDNDLVVKYNGEIMIKAIELETPELPDKFEYKVLPDGSRVWNAWNENPQNKFRREIALKPDNTVEITLACDVPIRNKKRNRGLQLRLPYDFFAGGKYRALHNTSRSWNYREGVFTPDMQSMPRGVWRFLALEKGNKKLIFDMNALGAGDFCNMYDGGAVLGIWSIIKRNDDLLLHSGNYIPVIYNYLGMKIVIREGVFEDFDKLHALREFDCNQSFRPLALYSFGAGKTGQFYQAANSRNYTTQDNFGWLDSNALTLHRAHSEGAYYAHMAGKDATFRQSGLAPGYYIVTAGAGNGSDTPNKFSIRVNGEELEKNISVKHNTVHVASKTFHVGKDGIIDVKFDGEFIVSAIGIQFLVADAEDYWFKRAFWVSNGFEPGSIYRNTDYMGKPEFALASDTFVLPQPGKEAANPVKIAPGEVCLPDPNSPELAWLATGNWFKVLSNASTLGEAADPAVADWLIKSMTQGKNYSAVMTSGMHSRHTYMAHTRRGIDSIKLLAETADKYKLKLIDHHDATLCWNVDAGFRFLAEHLQETSRNHDTLLPTFQLCPSDPDFCERYYAYLVELVKNGVDGFQIDELVYENNCCSCQHCREKFYQATGCYYPVNELDKAAQDPYSELRRNYFMWKKKSTADWFVELRKRCMPYNKNLLLCMYTTHWGFTLPNPRYGGSSCLFDMGRAINYFGTEVMTRNPLMSYRNLLPHRRMKNVLNLTYNTPIWAWIYATGHPRIYAGWAICNMAKQVALLPEMELQAGEADFVKFDTSQVNMPRAGVQAHSQVALLFSQASRDWNSNISFVGELFGLAQTLDTQHISYEFICDNQLNTQDLSKYKVLFLAVNNCISDSGAQAIKEFVRNGGIAIVTPYSGINDELGRDRKEWLFADVFNFSPNFNSYRNITAIDGKKLAGKLGFPTFDNSNSQSAHYGQTADGKNLPLVLESAYGKGKMIYIAGVFGSQLYEDEGNYRKPPREKEFDPVIEEFFGKLVTELSEPGRVWYINAPEKVLTALWRNDKKIYVHLFNATGVTVKAGALIQPQEPQVPYLPLNNDITFTLKNVKNGKVIACSPDFEGAKELKTTYSNGDLQVTLPKEMLKVYTLIHIEQ